MNFKLWFKLSETLDPAVKGALEQDKAPPIELAAFIKELEDEPNLIDRKTAFTKLRERFPLTKQKPVKQEDGQTKFYQDKLNTKQITKPEFDVFLLFKNENKQQVTDMMNLLRRFIDNNIIALEVKNNKIYITRNEETKEFNDFTRFESELHAIEGSLTKYQQKSGMFNPIIGENKYKNNLVAKGDNVWVFKGDTPNLCSIFGKNQRWCISSSTSATYWFDYRINYHQTQYFVFDFNKDEGDPARYVNPGVAPEGGYSEWVDARNSHNEDQEDENSQIGINGYTSINQYKAYLASKGIPESIWTTTAPEDWERRLGSYVASYNIYEDNFNKAKNDPDSRVFPIYLKIVEKMKDKDFDTLTDKQKKEFVLGKLDNLTAHQFEFAKNTSGYYNSINSELSDSDIITKIGYNKKSEKDEIFKFIIKNKSDIEDKDFQTIIYYADNKDELIMYSIQNKSYLTYDNLNTIFWYSQAEKKYEIMNAVIDKLPNLDDDQIFNRLTVELRGLDNKDKIINLLIDKKEKISFNNVYTMVYHASNKYEIIKHIIEQGKIKLDYATAFSLLGYTDENHKKEILKLIMEKNPELKDYFNRIY